MELFSTDTTTEADEAADGPLRPRDAQEIRDLQSEIHALQDEIENLEETRFEASQRRQELNDEFQDALDGSADRSADEIRQDLVDLEERVDNFQQRRMEIRANIASKREELKQKAEEVKQEIGARVSPVLEDLHEELAEGLVKAAKAHHEIQKLDKLGGVHYDTLSALGRQEMTVSRPDISVDNPQFQFLNSGAITALVGTLEELREDGFDVPSELIQKIDPR